VLDEPELSTDRRQPIRRRRDEPAGRVVPVGRDGLLPLSCQQLGQWFLYQWDPQSTTYHLPLVLRLRGELDRAALATAVRAVLVRHEGLRTRVMVSDGQPWQLIDPPPAELALPMLELPAIGWQDVAMAEISRPFRLLDEPGFRCCLGRLADDDHLLILTFHHIASDGWSLGIVAADLGRAYRAAVRGEPAELPRLAVQPADYAYWQHQHRDQLDAGLAFWTKQLADLPTIALPADRPRPAAPTGAGAGVGAVLEPAVAAGLYELAGRLRVSPLAVLLAGYSTVLHRYTGQTDLPIGSVFSGRTRTELEPMVGFFTSTVVLRTRIDGNPVVSSHIRDCHHTILQAMQHQDVPFPMIVDAVKPDRVPGRNPLFQTSLSLVPAQLSGSGGELAMAGVRLEPVSLNQRTGARFDLRCEAIPQPDGSLRLWVEYSTELFDEARIRALTEHFRAVLAVIVADAEQPLAALELLPDAERELVGAGFNRHADQPPVAFGGDSVVQLLAATARSAAGRCAVWCAGSWLSYAQLDAQASRLALQLADAGVSRGQVVGVCGYRSLELVIGMLAVLKAGAAYLPLDPDQPAVRSEFQLTDAGAVLLLAQPGVELEPPAGVSRIELAPAEQPHAGDPAVTSAEEYVPMTGTDRLPIVGGQDSAYLIYTSGSTGTPKGVLCNHAGLLNRLGWMQAKYPIDAADRVLQKTPYTFDVSVWEFWWPLLTGARLVLAAPGGHRDAGYLAAVLAEQQITVCHFVPSMLRAFLDQPAELPALRHLFCSGEALPADIRDRALSRLPAGRLHNLYGPTEASIDVTAWTCSAADGPTVVIGRPITNMQTYVLDPVDRLAPVGVTGRLFLAGVGLATGYLGRPGLTAERFVPCPFGEPGGRMYDSGDLARWRPDGTLEYHGRTDHQVKLNGQRIELGEIEHALTRHPAVTAAAVSLVDPGDGRPPFLAAYLTAAAPPPSDAALRTHLAGQLPLHMIPATITVLDTLPLNTSGKLDRGRLPAPGPKPLTVPTATERALAGIWISLLQPEVPPRQDHNFFQLGGSSLLVMQLISRIREAFGVEIPVQQVFLSPVLGDLAAELDRLAAMQVLGDADLKSIDDRLDMMSDEEIERMLAEEFGELGNPAGRAMPGLSSGGGE
jgi:amino acid adenylation domain-containing protein